MATATATAALITAAGALCANESVSAGERVEMTAAVLAAMSTAMSEKELTRQLCDEGNRGDTQSSIVISVALLTRIDMGSEGPETGLLIENCMRRSMSASSAFSRTMGAYFATVVSERRLWNFVAEAMRRLDGPSRGSGVEGHQYSDFAAALFRRASADARDANVSDKETEEFIQWSVDAYLPSLIMLVKDVSQLRAFAKRADEAIRAMTPLLHWSGAGHHAAEFLLTCARSATAAFDRKQEFAAFLRVFVMMHPLVDRVIDQDGLRETYTGAREGIWFVGT